jgi:hypothetical protein
MKLFWCLFLFVPFTGYSQNLVPNGSFEDTIACPMGNGQIDLANFWYAPTLGYTDLLHSCSTIYGINFGGYQLPHSGEAYSGILVGNPSAALRDYLAVPLIDTLTGGVCYQLTFYANLGHMKFSTDAIHAYFSDTLIDNIQHTYRLNYNPQIRNQAGNFLDTLNWTLIQGEFEADGGEAYLIIGNFDSSANCNWIIVDSSITNNPSTYVKIDNIELITSVCTGFDENIDSGFKVFPNPITNFINITGPKNSNYTVFIHNSLSSIIYSRDIYNAGTIDLQSLAPGIYFFQIWARGKLTKSGKVIKTE